MMTNKNDLVTVDTHMYVTSTFNSVTELIDQDTLGRCDLKYSAKTATTQESRGAQAQADEKHEASRSERNHMHQQNQHELLHHESKFIKKRSH